MQRELAEKAKADHLADLENEGKEEERQSAEKLPLEDFYGKWDLKKNQVLSMIMAPSRELVIQIFEVLKKFEGVLGHSLAATYFIGGDKLEYDLYRIREKGAHLVVTTPGRLFDLVQKHALCFKKLEVFVMDEADKLLDQGGREAKLESILTALPK